MEAGVQTTTGSIIGRIVYVNQAGQDTQINFKNGMEAITNAEIDALA